jgi:hypothetical protein
MIGINRTSFLKLLPTKACVISSQVSNRLCFLFPERLV